MVDGVIGVYGYVATWPYTTGGVTYHCRGVPARAVWLAQYP
jgi:hypothetical protein